MWVTSQAALMSVKPSVCITHKLSHMLLSVLPENDPSKGRFLQ